MQSGCNSLFLFLQTEKQRVFNKIKYIIEYIIMNKRLVCVGMMVLGLFMSCSHRKDAEEADSYEVKKDNVRSDEVVYEKEAAKAAGVTTETIRGGLFSGIILASGKITSASDDETVVVANVSGIVHFRRKVSEGMKIEKDGTIFVLSSEHIQDGDPVKRAAVVYETAKRDFERAEKLVEEKIISEKDFNVIKGVYEEARLAYEATAYSRQTDGTAVKSPMNGYIKNCVVTEGDYVTVGQPLARIVRNNKLYLQADVSVRHYADFDKIKKAKFRTSYCDSIYDTEEMSGRLLSYGRAINDASGYIPVIFELDNPGSLLSGSFADIYIHTDERQNVISVPLSAIIEEQGVKFVYVQDDDDCYHKQEVRLGMSDGERIEVLSGIDVGDKVVVQGAVRVKLAATGNAIPAHTHNH